MNPLPIQIRSFTKNKDVDSLILSNLSYQDVSRVCQVNTYVNTICEDDNFWRNKLRKDFPLRSKYIYYTEYLKLSPKELYKVILSPSKIVELKIQDFPQLAYIRDDEDLYINFDGYNVENRNTEKITEAIRSSKESLPLLRGDVISLSWFAGYRNVGKVIWDGEKAVLLDIDIDEYSHISNIFPFPEFPLSHFHKSIVHNHIIFLSQQSIEEAIQNFNEKEQSTTISDLYYSYVVRYMEEDPAGRGFILATLESFPLIIKKRPFIQEIDDDDYLIAY
jgi:hypothetical protein